jgi:hypothetical protein
MDNTGQNQLLINNVTCNFAKSLAGGNTKWFAWSAEVLSKPGVWDDFLKSTSHVEAGCLASLLV